MHPIGDYMIKHGESLLVYNLYGKNFGNKIATKKGKAIEKSIPEDFSNTWFEFQCRTEIGHNRPKNNDGAPCLDLGGKEPDKGAAEPSLL